MSSKLRGKVVVVTGASSGIGRATAIAFAREGCHVALAARREADLDETARLCLEAGASAIVVPTDVSHEGDVRHLARRAIEELGRIDIWVSNAGVTLFGLLADLPFDEHRRVIETNLFGAMYGARVALPYFKAERRGVLINVGSVLSKVGQPFVPSYVISKFAIRGLTEALRVEVAELPDVHVCSVLPYATDTPHFEEGANVRGKRTRPMPPTQSPEKVARAIVKLAAHPQREVLIPRAATLGVALHWLAPRTMERLLLRALYRWHFESRSQDPTQGNLHTPTRRGEGSIRGHREAGLSTPVFIAWCLVELGWMAVESVERMFGSRKPFDSRRLEA